MVGSSSIIIIFCIICQLSVGKDFCPGRLAVQEASGWADCFLYLIMGKEELQMNLLTKLLPAQDFALAGSVDIGHKTCNLDLILGEKYSILFNRE